MTPAATEETPDVPAGWFKTMIGTVAKLNPAKPSADAVVPDTPVTFVPMPAVDADAGAITAPSQRPFGEVRKGFTFFKDEDVIVAKITPCFENGKAAFCRGLVNGLGFGSTEFHVLRSTGAVLPEYLYHFVRQEKLRRDGAENMTGSVGQKRVPADWLSNVPLPLPPLAEQKRIVAKVEAVLARANAARERLAKMPTLLKRFRQSVLAAACSGRVTADWRDSNARRSDVAALLQQIRTEHGYERPDLEDEANEMPPGWQRTLIGSITEPGASGRPFITSGSRGWAKYVGSTGSHFIRSENINTEFLRIDDSVRVAAPDGAEATRTQVRSGDLLLTITGNNVGRTAVVPAGCQKAFVSQHVAIIRLSPRISVDYVWLWLRSVAHGQAQLQGYFYGYTKPGLNLEQIRNLWINLPPVEEQAEIVVRVRRMFDLADKIEAKVMAGTMRAEKLVQATLAKAFRGELVPTEAELAEAKGRTYETAEALLERIRRQQEVAMKPSRGKLRSKVAVEPSFAGGLFGNANDHDEDINPIAKRLGVLRRRWHPAPEATTPVEDVLVRAFKAVCDQNSPDKVVADAQIHRAFVRQCRVLGLENPEFDLCFGLLNLRKASGLKGLGSTRKPIMDQWRYAGASEIAARVLNWRHGLSLDRILCDLTHEQEFEHVAQSITPGFSSFQYRWAALGLRKQGKKAAQKVVQQLRWSDPVSFAAVGQLPAEEGIYALHDPAGCVYIGGADDINASVTAKQGLAGQDLFSGDYWHPDPDRLVWKYAVADMTATGRQEVVNSLIAGWQPILNVLRVA